MIQKNTAFSNRLDAFKLDNLLFLHFETVDQFVSCLLWFQENKLSKFNQQGIRQVIAIIDGHECIWLSPQDLKIEWISWGWMMELRNPLETGVWYRSQWARVFKCWQVCSYYHREIFLHLQSWFDEKKRTIPRPPSHEIETPCGRFSVGW